MKSRRQQFEHTPLAKDRDEQSAREKFPARESVRGRGFVNTLVSAPAFYTVALRFPYERTPTEINTPSKSGHHHRF